MVESHLVVALRALGSPRKSGSSIMVTRRPPAIARPSAAKAAAGNLPRHPGRGYVSPRPKKKKTIVLWEIGSTGSFLAPLLAVQVLPPKRGRAGFFLNIMGQCRYRRWKKGSVGNKTSLLGQCRYCAVAVQVFRWQRGQRAIANGHAAGHHAAAPQQPPPRVGQQQQQQQAAHRCWWSQWRAQWGEWAAARGR